jgi:hypothetical protein
VSQLAQQAVRLGLPGGLAKGSITSAEQRDAQAVQDLHAAGAAEPFNLAAFEAACRAAQGLGLAAEVATGRKALAQRRAEAVKQLQQMAGSCPSAADILAQAAAAEALGAVSDAAQARQMLQQRQQQVQAELQQACTRGCSGAAQLQELLGAARLLEVPEVHMAATEGCLQAWRLEAEAALAAAAQDDACSLADVISAARSARQLGGSSTVLRAAAVALHNRQQQAAAALQRDVQQALAALRAAGDKGGAAAASVAAAALQVADAIAAGSTCSPAQASRTGGCAAPGAGAALPEEVVSRALQQQRALQHLGSQLCAQVQAALVQMLRQAQAGSRLGLAGSSCRAAMAALQAQAGALHGAGEHECSRHMLLAHNCDQSQRV